MDAYRHQTATADGRADAWLTGCVDAGLAGTLLLVPLILGGRIALGQLLLVVLATWTAACWCLRQALRREAVWIRSPLELLLLAALALVGLQMVPLPPSWLSVLSPHLREILPLWTPQGDAPAALGAWSTLSLYPTATRNGFILLLAFALLLLTTVQRVQRVADVERLLRWIAAAALAAAVFGLVQQFTNNGKYFWFYEHPLASTDHGMVGSFTNRNHFAHFIALGIGPLVWWLLSTLHGNRRRQPAKGFTPAGRGRSPDIKAGMLAIGLGTALFAVLLSLSRGGAMATLVAMAACTLILYRGSLVGRRTLLAVTGVGLLVGAFLAVHGYELVAARLDDFRSIEDLDNGGRLRLWQADARAAADFPLVGTGLGSHREVCPTYLQNETTARGIEYTHAENGYVQVAMEAGVPGLLLVLAAAGLCVFWCAASLRKELPIRMRLCQAAVAAGLAASAAHSMTDFVWYVPGCMVPTVLLAACACRLWQFTREGDGHAATPCRLPRSAWLTAGALVLVLGCFMAHNRLLATRAEPMRHRCLVAGRNVAELDESERPPTLVAMHDALSAALRCEPDRARAHARLAAVHLAMFNHPTNTDVAPLDVQQVRDAATASNFATAEALHAWLSQAFGDRRTHLDAALLHARRAVALCPLQGECYLLLADLCFLEGPDSPGKAAYISQALRVRPDDGAVLFAAGQEAALEGNVQRAIEYWRASAQAGFVHRRRLLDLLMPQVPVAAVLEIVRPGLAGLERMRTYYRRSGRQDQLPIVEDRIARLRQEQAATVQGTAAAECWLEAAAAHENLKNSPECLRCLRNAVECDASHFPARRQLGLCLLGRREFAEAEQHLRWCLQHRPQDEQLRNRLEAAVDGRLRQGSTAARQRKRPFPK